MNIILIIIIIIIIIKMVLDFKNNLKNFFINVLFDNIIITINLKLKYIILNRIIIYGKSIIIK